MTRRKTSSTNGKRWNKRQRRLFRQAICPRSNCRKSTRESRKSATHRTKLKRANRSRSAPRRKKSTMWKMSGSEGMATVIRSPGCFWGFLPWSETNTAGLKLDKDGGTWVTTTLPESSVSQIVRKADLSLTSDGSLEGKLTVTFTGLEAQWRRVQERNEDEAHRKRLLEDYVKEIVRVGIEVERTNKPEWTISAPSLVAEYTLKVPGWVAGSGKRALGAVGLFSGPEKHMFEHSIRVHPHYFHYLFEKADDV